MAKNRICPKCGQVTMYTTGGGCNYHCPLCNHSFYEAPPRPHISRSTPSAMRDISNEARRASADFDDALQSMKDLSRAQAQEREARKQQRKVEKQRRKEEEQQRKVEKLQSEAAKLQGKAEKLQNKAEAQRRKAQKKQEKKGISIGTIIGVIIVLWLIAQFFST